MPEENPFTKTHRALFDLMAAWPPIKEGTYKVKLGNFVSYLSGRKPEQPRNTTVQDLDFRELRIRPAGFSAQLPRTSNSGSVNWRWIVELSTNRMQADVSLHPVQWEVMRALSTWMAVVGALTWQGKVFNKVMRGIEVANELDVDELNRGTPGWAAIFGGEIEMFFTTTDLQNPAL